MGQKWIWEVARNSRKPYQLSFINERENEPPYLPASTTMSLLQGWLWQQITHEVWFAIKQRNPIKEW